MDKKTRESIKICEEIKQEQGQYGQVVWQIKMRYHQIKWRNILKT
jgi:hypothetical protein